MDGDYLDLEVVIKIPKLTSYAREVSGQHYDVFVKRENRVLLYTNIKASRLSNVLEVLILNPAQEVEDIPE